jgi:hypothetical protein
MAMGRGRKRTRQEGLWTPTAALPVGASHPFYQRLNQILDEKKFDEYVEGICERFYADEVGRAGTGARDLFSATDGGVLRRDRLGTRNRVAGQRQFIDSIVCADRAG